MHRPVRLIRAATTTAALAILGLSAATAFAAAQRTFVRSDGVDPPANPTPCSLAQPCRSFNAAIGQTLPGGEVVILDTAGYGAMTINKAIKIIGPSGVYGGISVQGGANPTIGITINAGDTDVITLRGLDIAGVPGVSGPFPQYGIDIQNAGTVHIEKSSIGNFTQDTSACISAVTMKPVNIFINDSFLRECRNGIFVNGTGPDDASRANLVVDNTRIEHMINTVGSGTSGVRVLDAVVGSVRNSVIAFAGDGVHVSNSNNAVNQRFHVYGSQITRMGRAALETSGGAGASLHINLENSLINNANAGLLHGRGQAIFTSSVIANNANSFVDCGGGAAGVQSLGYGAGIGSNSVYNNADTALPGGCTAYITPTLFAGK